MQTRLCGFHLGFLSSLALVPFLSLNPAQAANFTQTGTLSADDSVQLFTVTVATPGAVDIRSFGYAGGAASNGTTVDRGGFDPILSLFDSSGRLISTNDDGAVVSTDPTTGLAGDSRITTALSAGNYLVALTQYDNFPRGSFLSEGFIEEGYPNFTADPGFAGPGSCPGNMFRDISGSAGQCRTGNFTLDFLNVASVTPGNTPSIPEPGTTALLSLGCAALGVAIRRRNR